MIDRVGQVWEFSDGLVLLVVRTSVATFNEKGAVKHDVIVLVEGTDSELLVSGKLDSGWLESDVRTWDSFSRSERKRHA